MILALGALHPDVREVLVVDDPADLGGERRMSSQPNISLNTRTTDQNTEYVSHVSNGTSSCVSLPMWFMCFVRHSERSPLPRLRVQQPRPRERRDVRHTYHVVHACCLPTSWCRDRPICYLGRRRGAALLSEVADRDERIEQTDRDVLGERLRAPLLPEARQPDPAHRGGWPILASMSWRTILPNACVMQTTDRLSQSASQKRDHQQRVEGAAVPEDHAACRGKERAQTWRW